MNPNITKHQIINDFIPREKIDNMPCNLKRAYSIYLNMFGNIPFHSIRDKFQTLNFILTNQLITEELKQGIFTIFSINQCAYRILCRFCYLYKLKKSNVFTNDLSFEDLTLVNEKQKIIIHCQNLNYYFRTSDLVNIITKSILTCPEMFVEPSDIKNPWTNIPFSKSNLYNIYFQLKRRNISLLLFDCYFKTNFILKNFSTQFEPLIMDEYLKTYIYELSIDKRFVLINELLTKYKRSNKILRNFRILRQYSKNVIVEKFAPFLKRYLFVKHSLNQTNRFENEQRLIKELTKFINSKPILESKPKTNKRCFIPHQIVFHSLLHINIVSFNKKKEIIFKNETPITEVFTRNSMSTEFVFRVPIIKNKVSSEFIKKNKENIERDNNRRLRLLELYSRNNTLNFIRESAPSPQRHRRTIEPDEFVNMNYHDISNNPISNNHIIALPGRATGTSTNTRMGTSMSMYYTVSEIINRLSDMSGINTNIEFEITDNDGTINWTENIAHDENYNDEDEDEDELEDETDEEMPDLVSDNDTLDEGYDSF